jgi:exodeoxyribonuclease VII large subunit
LQKQIALRRARFSRATSQLDALSPLSVLGRGYAIVRDSEGGVVREALRVSPGAALSITVQRGTLSASVTEVRRDPKDNGGL